MRLISETIQKVAPAESRPWEDRIVLGCWAVGFILPLSVLRKTVLADLPG
jgi:hypothetical protein